MRQWSTCFLQLGMAECSSSKDNHGVSDKTVATPPATLSVVGKQFSIKKNLLCVTKVPVFCKEKQVKAL